jgi:hypothetical protein
MSKTYRYTVTVPAGWTTTQAFEKWDGESELDGTSAAADLLGQPSDTKGVWVAAAPSKRTLEADVAYAITWTDHYHGDYCPPQPNSRSPITVGGQPGVLLRYNCGILVNVAVTVDRGVEYWFNFIDRSMAAAADPADTATFTSMLTSVRFPH